MDFKKVMRLLQDFFEEQKIETALIGGGSLWPPTGSCGPPWTWIS